MGLGKFWPDLEISEAFLMGLEVSRSSDFCVSESRICLFFFPFGLQKSKFFRFHLDTGHRSELVD